MYKGFRKSHTLKDRGPNYRSGELRCFQEADGQAKHGAQRAGYADVQQGQLGPYGEAATPDHTCSKASAAGAQAKAKARGYS